MSMGSPIDWGEQREPQHRGVWVIQVMDVIEHAMLTSDACATLG